MSLEIAALIVGTSLSSVAAMLLWSFNALREHHVVDDEHDAYGLVG